MNDALLLIDVVSEFDHDDGDKLLASFRERLLGAAADHARRLLVFSHPPRNPVSRAVIAGGNLLFRLKGDEFRTFVHPPEAMLDVLARHGFRRTYGGGTLAWRVAGLERESPAA